MDFKPHSADWRSILLVIFGLSGTFLAISSAIGILIFTAMNNIFLLEAGSSPLASVLTASTLIAMGLLLMPMVWLSARRLRGLDFDTFVLPSLRPLAWVAIPTLWVAAITLATLYHNAPGANWFIPVLHFLSIALPIYLVIRIGINRISLGSSQRAWGVFGIGMTLGPILAVIGEVAILILGVLGVAIYLALNPEKIAEIELLINQFEQTPNLDDLLVQAGPLLKSPLTLLAALSFLSFLVPIIEETAKTLGVWLVSDRLTSPAQGFALGVLSGAGFALAESLSASLTADDTWAVTLSMRAVSGSMHMLASGIAGWGIAYARLEKRYFRLAGMMLLAILLHAAWNAGAVLSVWGGLRSMLAMPDIDFWGALAAITGMSVLFILISSMVIAFFLINKRLRTSSPPSALSQTAQAESRFLSGEQDNQAVG